MDIENQLIFFFSALGAFNGFILAIYFAVTPAKNKAANYFLSLMLMALSVRIIKSVFFYFNPNLTGSFIQLGLSACLLIGPALYLYLRSQIHDRDKHWALHIFPFLVGISLLGTFYPYVEHRTIWNPWIVWAIYGQWLLYILTSFSFVRPIVQKLFQRQQKLNGSDTWLLSIYAGVAFVWFAYMTSSYTSYIVGALSFSFVLYLIVLMFVFRNKKSLPFFDKKEKYGNKAIDTKTQDQIKGKLRTLKKEERFLDPNLSLTGVARELHVSPHTLSQFLNDNLGKSFSTFINEWRIEKAKTLLLSDTPFTIETLGYESGFNSKSTFYTTFKKYTGLTPSEFRDTQGV